MAARIRPQRARDDALLAREAGGRGEARAWVGSRGQARLEREPARAPRPKAVAAVRAAAVNMHVYPDGGAYTLKTALGRTVRRGQPAGPRGQRQRRVDPPARPHPPRRGVRDDDGRPRLQPVRRPPRTSRRLASSRCRSTPTTGTTCPRWPARSRRGPASSTSRTPNNPTGTIVRKPEMDRFLADIPDDVVVVLDEAYMEFAEGLPDFPNSLDYVRGREAERRGPPDLQQGLWPRRGSGWGTASRRTRSRTRSTVRASPSTSTRSPRSPPVAALGDDDHLRDTVETNRRGLARLAGAFAEVGARPLESFAQLRVRRPG